MKYLTIFLGIAVAILLALYILRPIKETVTETVKVEIKTDTIIKFDTVKVIKFKPVKETVTVYITPKDTSHIRSLAFKDSTLELSQDWKVKNGPDSLINTSYSVRNKTVLVTDSVFTERHTTIVRPHQGFVLGAGVGFSADRTTGNISLGYQFKNGWILSAEATAIDKSVFYGPKIQKTF